MAEGTNLRTGSCADKHLPSVCAGKNSVQSGVTGQYTDQEGIFYSKMLIFKKFLIFSKV